MISSLSEKIAEICDYSFNAFESKASIKTNDGLLKYKLIHLTSQIFANVTLESFFGAEIR